MLTASSRVCSGCALLLPEPPAAQVCTRCGRVAVPQHTDWPRGMKRWLVARFCAQFWAPWAAFTEQYRWERLLRAVIAGSTWQDRIVPYAATTEDCYLVAAANFTTGASLEATRAPDPRSSPHAA